jgi:signal transduction histidine kinase
MKIKNSLRFRFVTSFFIFALLITFVFALIVYILERTYVNEFLQKRIHSELNYFTELYQKNKQAPLPVAEDIRSYLGKSKMPSDMQKAVKGLSDGVYSRKLDRFEFQNRSKRLKNLNLRRAKPIFFGIRSLPDNQKVYIFANFEFWHQKQGELRTYTFSVYIFVIFFAIIVGFITAKRVIIPLNRLMVVINKAGPDNIPLGFSKSFKNDEFGALAKALEASLNRVKKFIKREHQFTRDASHELRSPVTVIKGAVELLEMTSACKEETVNKLVQRIERSTRDMETTIESLLWLARESNADESSPPAELLPLVQNAIEQNRHLIAGKPVEIDLQVVSPPLVSAPAGVLTIAISNLIRNACQFTVQGKIIVTLKQNCVEVSDTGVGIEEDDLNNITKPAFSSSESDGFGFGLDIVNRLCSRFGWQLKIESTPGQSTKTVLIFPHD